MVVLKEEEFVEEFVLSAILSTKESVFEINECERVEISNNFWKIFNQMLEDELVQKRFFSIIPSENISVWQNNVNNKLKEFLNRDGVDSLKTEDGIIILIDYDQVVDMMQKRRANFQQTADMGILISQINNYDLSSRNKQKKLVCQHE